MPDFLIRKATGNDLSAIETIYNKIHDAEAAGLQTTGWIRGVYPVRQTTEAALQRDDLYVLEENGIGEEEKKSVIMVGDRKHDVEGAKKTGLSVVGVLYGYGSREELQDAGADYLCETPGEVAELLRSLAFADGNSLN